MDAGVLRQPHGPYVMVHNLFSCQVKLTQEVKVRFIEQLSSLQSKQQQELELLEDIR